MQPLTKAQSHDCFEVSLYSGGISGTRGLEPVLFAPYGLQKPASEERNNGMTELATAIEVIVLFGTIGLLVVDYVSRRGR